MCIRDSDDVALNVGLRVLQGVAHAGLRGKVDDAVEALFGNCLLYTSDAADERSSVDLGGRRIIKKKKNEEVGRKMHKYHINTKRSDEYMEKRDETTK